MKYAAPIQLPADPASALQAANRNYVDAAARSFLPVANRSHFNGNGGNASTSLIQQRGMATRVMARVIAGGATQLQVEWANIWTSVLQSGYTGSPAVNGSCEVPGPNSVTLRCSIEYPAGNWRQVSTSTAWSSVTAYILRDQVTYGGSMWVAIQAGTNQIPATGSAYWTQVYRYQIRWDADQDVYGTMLFNAGDYRKSIPISLSTPMTPGDLIAVNTIFDTGSTTNYLPYAGDRGASNTVPFVDWVMSLTSGMPAGGTSTDITTNGINGQTNGNTTVANNTNVTTRMNIAYPTAITGNVTTKKCVALFGDSLISGVGGDFRDGEACGIFPRVCDGSSWWRIAQQGNRAACYTLQGNAPWQMSVVRRCTAVVTQLAMNDLQMTSGNTYTAVQANMLGCWNALAATGTPVYVGLMTPISSSSDSWATVANQGQFTGGGGVATTQFPGGTETYAASVYGQLQKWLSQQAGQITVDGTTVAAGQYNHPVDQILDWRSVLTDGATGWKWATSLGTSTTDGAHPNPTSVMFSVAYAQAAFEPILVGRQQGQQPFLWDPTANSPLANMPRSLIRDSNAGTANTFMTVIGTSTGRYIYGVRFWQAGVSKTSVVRAWTILTGLDPSYMQVLASGTYNQSTIGATAALVTLLISTTPVWVPAGQLIAVAIQTDATAAYLGGLSATSATVHPTGSSFLLAGTSADTAALSGDVSLYSTTKFTANAHRTFAEIL